jgi:hypothetical protein
MKAGKTGRFGGLLLATGAAVGVAAVVGIVTGFEPSRLPAALIDIAVYKLTFAAAAGLLTAGAIVRRYAKREADESPPPESALPHVQSEVPRLPDAPAADFVANPDRLAEVKVPKQH